jgi:hypothetical protein
VNRQSESLVLSAKPSWVNFDSDYLQGEFDFEVEGGSTQPVNESFRRQMAMQVVDAMAPFAGAGIVDMPKLANYVLQYGFGIKNAASFITAARVATRANHPSGCAYPSRGNATTGNPRRHARGHATGDATRNGWWFTTRTSPITTRGIGSIDATIAGWRNATARNVTIKTY